MHRSPFHTRFRWIDYWCKLSDVLGVALRLELADNADFSTSITPRTRATYENVSRDASSSSHYMFLAFSWFSAGTFTPAFALARTFSIAEVRAALDPFFNLPKLC